MEEANLQERIQHEITGLALSVAEVVKKFRELHHPLAESQEQVPRATRQLDKISEQTEAATHGMLDTIERMLEREDKTIANLREMKGAVAERRFDGIDARIDGLIENSNTNLNDTYVMMEALQFQDITSQQISHAAVLLEDIGGKLQTLLEILNGQPGLVESADPPPPRKERAFDPHADLYERQTDQKTVDSIIAERK